MQIASLNIVAVSDNPSDVELVAQLLQRAALNPEIRVVDSEKSLRSALQDQLPELILSDFKLPQFSGLDALLVTRDVCPDTPFILVSEVFGEDHVIHALKSGATDYVLKHDLARLAPAVRRALGDAKSALEQRRTLEALRHSELRFRLAASTGDVWDWDIETGLAQISPQWKMRLGYSEEDVENTAEGWLALLEPADRVRVLAAFSAHIRNHVPYDVEYRALAKDGSYRWSHAKGQAVWNAHGRATYMAGSVVDITERKNAEIKVQRLNRVYAVLSGINSLIVRTQNREELFQEACNIAVHAGGFKLAWIGLVDNDSQRVAAVAWSGAGQDYIEHIPMGMRVEQESEYGIVGQSIREGFTILVQNTAKDERIVLKQQALDRGFASFAVLPLSIAQQSIGVLVLYSEETHFFDDEEVLLLEELANDIAFSLDHLEKAEELNYLAYYDALTGLPNRSLLQDRIRQLTQNNPESSSKMALLWFNVDRFRNVNDTLGRHVGDVLLKLVALRLSEVVGRTNQIARIGADQFGCVLTHCGSPSDVAHFLREKVQPQIDKPFQVEGKELYLTLRAGIAMFPEDGHDADVLLTNAEAACREASASQGRYQFYATSMNTRVRNQLSIESKLHKALKSDQFLLHYQPKVGLHDGKITGMEALIRWQDPEVGLIPPAQFVPILEETGMIGEVGQWVIERALADHAQWCALGLVPPRIAVNVSAVQMRRADFADAVRKKLQAFNASILDIEITESLFVEDVASCVQCLRKMREFGVRVAVDDFGTGYSSLAYLKKLPIDYLKVDQSFVKDVIYDPDAAAICIAIIDLAHNLKLKVIAEGVETEAQMNYLRRKHCDEIQGYYFSKPLSMQDMGQLLHTGACIPVPREPDAPVRRILVVDDEPGILSALRRVLRRDGYEILAASSAKEGLRILGDHDVQVILSDQRMPEMSGTEFLSRVRDLYPETIRIILSGYTDLESIADAINRGSIYKFLTKPWDDDLLRENIREAFNHHDSFRNRAIPRLDSL